jgi:hypothetical protein
MKALGGLIFAAGVVLFIGNISGKFRTFPFAGYLGMLIGGAIMRAG